VSSVGIEVVARTGDLVGESAFWSPDENALYWADLFRPAIHRMALDDARVDTWIPPQKLGSFVLRADGTLLVAGRTGLAIFDPRDQSYSVLCNPDADRPANILNDGKCDRRGRFWVGSMERGQKNPAGRLYRFDADRQCHILATDILVPNSLAFSPDDRVMYFADTFKDEIYAFDFDVDSGVIRNRRLFCSTHDQPGGPDGSTVDADGCLWNAQWRGGRLVRYRPDGRIDGIVELPVSQPTHCAFGGAKLDTLFVTTACFGLGPEGMEREPLAGSVLALDVGVAGLREPMFAG
jgi:sugar lactone lactonase YvrE